MCLCWEEVKSNLSGIQRDVLFFLFSYIIPLSDFSLFQQQRNVSPWLKRETIRGIVSVDKPAVDSHGLF